MLPDALVHRRVATHIGPGARGCDEIRPRPSSEGSGGPSDPSADELKEHQSSEIVMEASSGSERDCEHALGGAGVLWLGMVSANGGIGPSPSLTTRPLPFLAAGNRGRVVGPASVAPVPRSGSGGHSWREVEVHIGSFTLDDSSENRTG
jgi:hypothetical protein